MCTYFEFDSEQLANNLFDLRNQNIHVEFRLSFSFFFILTVVQQNVQTLRDEPMVPDVNTNQQKENILALGKSAFPGHQVKPGRKNYFTQKQMETYVAKLQPSSNCELIKFVSLYVSQF